MTAPVRFCCCAHPRSLHQKNPFNGKRSGPCKPSCGCSSYRPSPVPMTAPVLAFMPAEDRAEEAG